jgi:LCP family protein required for cell wall assembly
MSKLITSADKPLQGEDDDRINFLLIGMGGKEHEGGTLADTIILGSIKPSTKQASVMSIPRDSYVKDDKYGWVKINAINAYAEKNESGSGGRVMAETISKMLGTDIPYYATVDFDGFEQIIDEFGGVDVTVDNDLIDYQYPIRGREYSFPISSRYEKLVIRQGQQQMDGATALKYARSRHGLGPEGSDFARSKRQQKVILALKEKIFQLNNIFNPKKINALLSAYNEHVSTNLEVWEMLKLGQLAKDIDTTKLLSINLTDGADSFLYARNINGAYVLLPRDGSFEKISYNWQNIFNPEFSSSTLNSLETHWNVDFEKLEKLAQQQEAERRLQEQASSTATSTDTVATSTEPLAEEKPAEDKPQTIAEENANVEILNGTAIAGWATTEKNKLIAAGLTVGKIGNAPTQDYQKILIYDLSGNNPLTVAELKKIYGITASKSKPETVNSSADILIILGKSQ